MVVLKGLVTVVATISFFTASLASPVKSEELANVAEEFKTAGIVPDVLPHFNPSALAYLTFAYPNGTWETIAPPGLRIGRDGKPCGSLTYEVTGS